MSEKTFGNWEERGLMNSISCALLCDTQGKRWGGRKEHVLLWVIKQSLQLFNAVWMLEPLMSCGCGNALRSFPGRVEDGLSRRWNIRKID